MTRPPPRIVQQIRRWDLALLKSSIKHIDGEAYGRLEMVNRTSGVRGGRYRNKRVFIVTHEEFIALRNVGAMIRHANFEAEVQQAIQRQRDADRPAMLAEAASSAARQVQEATDDTERDAAYANFQSLWTRALEAQA